MEIYTKDEHSHVHTEHESTQGDNTLQIPVTVKRFNFTCPLNNLSGIALCLIKEQEDSKNTLIWHVTLPILSNQPVQFAAETVEEAQDKVVELIKNHINSALDLAMLVQLD